jgi:DNA-directed RNA polymerase subunit RPC12/RpoP
MMYNIPGEKIMQLWETKAGDKWLCADCRHELTGEIKVEKWRLIFDQIDPELRCSHCGHGDVDVED